MKIDNEIPRSHPHRAAIERAIREAVGSFTTGSSAWIHVAPHKRISWMILVTTAAGACTSILAGPEEQNPEQIGAQLRTALAMPRAS